MKCPNFFIIGAPKCGTTALYTYLGEHPQVFMPTAKEPHYFAEDLANHRDLRDWQRYLELFTSARSEHRALGEASVFYLFSRVAIQRILTAKPLARFIVMLRNPLEMIPALHAQYVFTSHDDQPSFADAWRLQAERAVGDAIPPLCYEPLLLQYRELGMLGAQLQRALSLIDRERLHIVLYDDFARDTAGTYRKVLTFLGLDDDGRVNFPQVNANRLLRRPWLQHLLCHRRYPERLRHVGRWFGLHHLQRSIRLWNSRETHRAALAPELRAEMINAFRDDVTLLSDLVKRDLSMWLAN